MTKKEIEIERRKEEIINAAEKLFFNSSYDKISMDDISKRSEFSKRTVYKYFTNKEELFAAIAFKGLTYLVDLIKNSIDEKQLTFTNLQIIAQAFVNLQKSNLNYPKAICYLLTIITKNEVKGFYYMKCMNILTEIFDILKNLLENGIKEGSVKKDIDITKTIYSIQMIFAGVFSVNPLVFKNLMHTNLSFDEIFAYNYSLILMAIKS